jgi:hypothetical protein
MTKKMQLLQSWPMCLPKDNNSCSWCFVYFLRKNIKSKCLREVMELQLITTDRTKHESKGKGRFRIISCCSYKKTFIYFLLSMQNKICIIMLTACIWSMFPGFLEINVSEIFSAFALATHWLKDLQIVRQVQGPMFEYSAGSAGSVNVFHWINWISSVISLGWQKISFGHYVANIHVTSRFLSIQNQKNL